MRFMRIAVIGITTASGCTNPVTIEDELVGSWAVHETLRPRGSMDRVLAFDSDGRFTFTVNTYGVYENTDALSAYEKLRGHYAVESNRLVLELRSNEIWDSFYKNSTPSTSAITGTLFDDCMFSIAGNELRLRYTSYPADAPVPTELILRRR